MSQLDLIVHSLGDVVSKNHQIVASRDQVQTDIHRKVSLVLLVNVHSEKDLWRLQDVCFFQFFTDLQYGECIIDWIVTIGVTHIYPWFRATTPAVHLDPSRLRFPQIKCWSHSQKDPRLFQSSK